MTPTFAEALRFWLILGFIGFGGPAGQIAIMQAELVDRRRWIGQEQFLQALNFCMLLPGPEAQQLATYIGWKLHGLRGGLAAGILFILPGALILFGLAWIAAVHGDTMAVAAIFTGLKPVVVALVVHAVFRIGRRALKGPFAIALAALAFAALEFAHIPFPLVVLAAGLVGWFRAGGAPPAEIAPPSTDRIWPRLLRMAAIYAALLGIPTALLAAFAEADPFLRLGGFLTQNAFVTFGGAYAILPYVADAAVTRFHWLGAGEMVNGLALAETTPGPLILVLQYVGFFAGWNVRMSRADAALGAVVATYATFLPSIMLILTGAPYIERIARVRRAAGALSAITAAVVGVILTLAVFLARQVIYREPGQYDFVAIAAIGVAFMALERFKLALHWVVLAGAVFGFARAYLGF